MNNRYRYFYFNDGHSLLGFLTIAQNDHNLSNTIITTIVLIGIRTLNKKSYVESVAQKKSKFVSLQLQKRNYSSSTKSKYSKTLNDFIESKSLTPVFIYENLDENSVKKNMLNETKDLSGVYLILNKVNLDYYVGSASTGRIYTRFARHLINFNGSKIVKNAVKKYKLSCFAFMVLELYPEVVNKDNNKDLLNLEDFYIKSLLPNYNILTEAGSSFGYKHTEVTRIKMKANYSEQRRAQVGNLNKGKNLSGTTIESIRKKALNREKSVYSEQAIVNMKKSARSILLKNLDGTEYGWFPSVVETAKALEISVKTVQRSLKSPEKLLKRSLIISYAN